MRLLKAEVGERCLYILPLTLKHLSVVLLLCRCVYTHMYTCTRLYTSTFSRAGLRVDYSSIPRVLFKREFNERRHQCFVINLHTLPRDYVFVFYRLVCELYFHSCISAINY